MRPLFSHLQDTVAGTVGYVWRVVAGANRVKDAVFYSVPGYYARPGDEDDDTGRQDCLHMESGNERIVFATRNATGLSNLLDYISRALDKGEQIITAEDGTARCYVDWRPNGDLIIQTDNGDTAPNDKTITITCDASTGNVDVVCAGTTPGNFRIGGASANSKLMRYTEAKAMYDTAITGMQARFDNHAHQYNPGPLALAPTLGPMLAVGPSAVPITFPAWDVAQASTTGETD